ncbi:sensor histidine kinase [Mumia zhuanghuii]|uniref:sensor histidine kinase n=1 Tax=Mumia zhuanghuii TaxID=2585211 RepID=UPI0036353CD3
MSRLARVLPRHAAVLVWVPVLLAAPALEVRSGPGPVVLALGLVALAATSCVVAVLKSWPCSSTVSTAAWVVLTVSVGIGSLAYDGWPPAWLLVAMTAGVTFRPAVALGAITLAVVLATSTLARGGASVEDVYSQAFVVALAGAAAATFSHLVATADALRRTRAQLVVAAVADERERFSRDLHDVLGHTLSVMVVKAQAVRRLVPTDPDAAAVHAADIEQIGRTALTHVRETVHAVRTLTLTEQLEAAHDALTAAGIRADVHTPTSSVDPAVGTPLAWALREGVTNVLRHSSASTCRIDLVRRGTSFELRVCDDGVGTPPPEHEGRIGGLDGLRSRLVAAGGELEVAPGPDGFSLTARVPAALDAAPERSR